MNTIVIYKSKYGATKTYAERIAQELGCEIAEAKKVKAEDLEKYDTIIYGGGLYAEMIAGISLITKNFDKLSDKKIIVFSVGITPIDCREYYDDLVPERNFKPHMLDKINMYNFPGKMIMSELTPVHRTAIKTLKKIMSAKENPSQMEKLLADLCDFDGGVIDNSVVKDLVDFAGRK